MSNIVAFLKTEQANKWITSKFNNEKEINRFKSNLVAVSNNNKLLEQANPATIMTACYQGTLLDLPMEKNFGYAYIVPYIENGQSVAQFQMGYKGYIQLAMRTGQYLDIAVSDVKQGELINYNRLKGSETYFNWVQDEEERIKLPTVGYVAYFKLINGFEKTLYMTKQQMENHFMKYSKTYVKHKKFPISNFEDMALKTVLTSLLRKWGIMSIELQQAYTSDQAVIKQDGNLQYIDNENTVENDVKINELKNLDVSNQYYEDRLVSPYSNNNVVIEEDISNLNNDNWDME